MLLKGKEGTDFRPFVLTLCTLRPLCFNSASSFETVVENFEGPCSSIIPKGAGKNAWPANLSQLQ